ncbi:hypothetical protein MBUL_04503 (plasmid) [Methylobacterium bullatum]|uniref:DnaD N-terminal domain-containing protein n=1 Tax=Methylobacterium bullatum TaxID=570505 RepID=A0A679JRT0_9HYPH|nr:hypothetical protein MBUL_04503 [Methylobacterium bullatum]
MSKVDKASEADVEKLKTNERKWSKPLMAAGWNAIPNIIIEKQEALGIDALDMNIILHLTHYWWHPENLPHPSVETIAKAVRVQPRTVQKRVKALCELGLIERKQRRHTKHGSTTNLYSFNGLIKACTPYAEEKLAEIHRAKVAKEERLARKKPRLVINNDSDTE